MILRDALSFGGLCDAEILAGKDGLGNTVDSITTIEVTDSNLADWILKDQLYISALYSISDDVEKQKKLILLLKEHGASGLVLCHVGRLLKTVDGALTALCDEIAFPLIKANPDTTYMDILYPILNETLGGGSRERYPASELHGELLALLDGEDVDTTFSHIAGLQEVAVTYLDPYCNCVYSNKAEEVVSEERKLLLDNFSGYFMRLLREEYITAENGRGILRLIKAKSNTFGFLLLDPLGDQSRDELVNISETLGPLFTLVYGRRAKTLHLRDYYTEKYVKDLLVWNFHDTEQAVRRGLDVGLDIRGKDVFAVINLNNYHKTEAEGREKEQDCLKRVLLPRVSQICAGLDRKHFVHLTSDQILLILNSEGDYEKALEYMRRISDEFEQRQISVSTGVSSPFSAVTQIPAAYRQANSAFGIGRNFLGEGRVTAYRDVFFVSMAQEKRENAGLRRLAEESLRPLLEYDEAHGTGLTATLDTMLRNNCNMNKSAKQLFSHRNTVANHCEKIKEILGFSPFEPPYSINFLMSLHLLK